MSNTPAINLSTLPADQRAAVEALMQQVSTLKEITKRQEHLIAELNHALHGKRSEKLTEDERQLAFEDLTIAVEEVEAEKEARAASKGEGPRKKPAPRRNIGNLPASLPRIENVVEPDSLICPCGCGVAIVARTNGATIATAQDRRRSHRAVGHRACAAAGDCHDAPEICVSCLH